MFTYDIRNNSYFLKKSKVSNLKIKHRKCENSDKKCFNKDEFPLKIIEYRIIITLSSKTYSNLWLLLCYLCHYYLQFQKYN